MLLKLSEGLQCNRNQAAVESVTANIGKGCFVLKSLLTAGHRARNSSDPLHSAPPVSPRGRLLIYYRDLYGYRAGKTDIAALMGGIFLIKPQQTVTRLFCNLSESPSLLWVWSLYSRHACTHLTARFLMEATRPHKLNFYINTQLQIS